MIHGRPPGGREIDTLNPGPLRLLQITDTHFPRRQGELMQGVDTLSCFDQVVESVRTSRRRFDLVLLTGDLVHEPSPAAYASLRTRLVAAWPEIPCHCLPGNHDDPDMMAAALCTQAIHLSTLLEFDHWRMVFLNSRIVGEQGGFLDQGQFRLLNGAIAQRPEKHLLTAVHHHPWPCGSRWMDTMVINNGMRMLDCLQTSPEFARVVVFGHVHQTVDRMIGNVRLLGTPSTCVQFKPRSDAFALDDLPPGYRWITLHPDGSIDTEVVFCARA